MKKTLGVLLTLSWLVTSAACTASRATSKPKPPEPDPGESWSMTRPAEQLNGPANHAGSGAGKARRALKGAETDE